MRIAVKIVTLALLLAPRVAVWPALGAKAKPKPGQTATRGGANASDYLPAAKIAAFKKQPCTLLHVWATWCTICIQEMPDFVKVMNSLAADKRVTPIIIDASSVFQQDNFSKKYMATLRPSFKTYLKPAGQDEPYLTAIDKEWSGSLPWSALYHKGVRKKVWNGSIDLSRFRDDIATNCQ